MFTWKYHRTNVKFILISWTHMHRINITYYELSLKGEHHKKLLAWGKKEHELATIVSDMIIYFHYIDWERKLEARVLFYADQIKPCERSERLQLQEIHLGKGNEGKTYKLALRQINSRVFNTNTFCLLILFLQLLD